MLVILGTKRATACTVDTKGTDSSVCITKESYPRGRNGMKYGFFGTKRSVHTKTGFHQRQSWSQSRSHNQKRAAYDLVKTAF